MPPCWRHCPKASSGYRAAVSAGLIPLMPGADAGRETKE